MKCAITPTSKTLAVVKRMFYLAWQASGPAMGMGILQDRGPNMTEGEVWTNIAFAGDYPNMEQPKENERRADYVFGRMMKMMLTYSSDEIEFRTDPLSRDYEAWCTTYPSYRVLLAAACREVEAEYHIQPIAV